jgi:hypothetical protein
MYSFTAKDMIYDNERDISLAHRFNWKRYDVETKSVVMSAGCYVTCP